MQLDDLLLKLELEPNNVDLLCIIGKLYKEKADFENSKSTFLKIINLDPEYCPAACSLINLLIDFGFYTEGLNCFNDFIEKNISNPKYCATLVNALFAQYLLHSISCQSGSPGEFYDHNYYELFFKIGATLKKHCYYTPALKVYESASVLSNSNIRLQIDLAECYIKTSNYSKAIEILAELRNLYPEDLSILENLAEAYLLFGDSSNSKLIADKIADITQNNNNS